MGDALRDRLFARRSAGVRLAAVTLAWLSLPLPAGAQTAGDGASELPRGVVVERVTCGADASQSYALYLPPGYTPERRWPILYCFDPIARGAVPVERFKAAAERYGWVVVGSNNSRNGPLHLSLAAGAAVWEDTHARLAIDDRRVYTAGFSGGARVATLVAYGCDGCVAGVIACGAGFPSTHNPVEKPLPNPIRFAFFGAIGVDDYNFPELVAVDEALDRSGVDHVVRRFGGAHEWLPSDLCVTAVEWMELHAMRSGARPKEAAMLEAVYAKWLGEARALEGSQRRFEAFLAFEAIAARFAGLRDTAEAASRAAALRETAEVKAGFKEQAEQIRRQRTLAAELGSLAVARGDPDRRVEAIQEFRRRVADLKQVMRAEQDSPKRRVARRALNQILAFYFEDGLRLAAAGKLSDAAASLEIAADVVPKAPGILYELASIRARNGEKKRALETLHRAVEQGFGDAARLRADPAFEPLRSEPEFTRALERAASQSKS